MNQQKHLFILGAGLMQKPAIEAAHRLGFRVTVADANPDAPCKPIADTFIQIDLKDKDSLADYALEMRQKNGLDGVFTAGTDFSASVAWVAEKLSLPGHRYEAACNATDKTRMRDCFAKALVPSPLFAEFNSERADSLEKVLKTVRTADSGFIKEHIGFCADFPLVIKPVDNMGARGCRLVRSASELLPALRDSIKYSRTGRAIVEEYMEGPEFSADALVCGGKMVVFGLADRHIFYPPYFIEMGHTMPTVFGESDVQLLLAAFEKAVFALGLSHGAAKGDIKLTPKGPMIGEVAARLSGGFMSGWTFPLASGLNLTEQAILLAAGLNAPVFEQFSSANQKPANVAVNAFSAERAWVSIPGSVKTITGLDDAKKLPNVKEVLPRVFEGGTTVFPVNNVEKCGNIISSGHTREIAAYAAEEAGRCIVLRLEPHNPKTDDFLNRRTDFPPSAYNVPSETESCLETAMLAAVDCASSLTEQLPECLQSYAQTLVDWNRKSMTYALTQFSQLYKGSAIIPAAVFWKTFLRGGLQGILYLADSVDRESP